MSILSIMSYRLALIPYGTPQTKETERTKECCCEMPDEGQQTTIIQRILWPEVNKTYCYNLYGSSKSELRTYILLYLALKPCWKPVIGVFPLPNLLSILALIIEVPWADRYHHKSHHHVGRYNLPSLVIIDCYCYVEKNSTRRSWLRNEVVTRN